MTTRAKAKITLRLSPQAEKYARRDAPKPARLMAARGALPLPPVDLATVLFALMHDADAEVKSTARDSLEALPDSVVETVLQGPAHPSLLSHFAHVFAESEQRLTWIALNPAADDATFARLAECHHKSVVEIVSNNQERILRAPEIVDALGSNPLTGRSVIDRILSFLGEQTLGDDPETDASEVSDEEAEAALRAVLGDDLGSFARSLVAETDDGEISEEDLQSGNLYNLVQGMSVFQKIKLARLGNKEARALMIRDRNKIVATAAISSPKITDNEVIGIAQSRNVSDEVLRVIARNPQWCRGYQVKLALATNPKCPQPSAMKFVNYLQDNDLRKIMKSRDVPGPVSTQARRILSKKGKI